MKPDMIDLLNSFSERYWSVLRGTFSDLNLVGHKDYKIFFEEQIEDSASILEKSSFFSKNIDKKWPIVDVGFGGGFPLLPLACLLKTNNFIGLDARKKKQEAVCSIANLFEIKNVKTYHLRLDQLFVDVPAIFLAKAVGPCDRILSQIYSNQKINFILYKGPNFWEAEKSEIIKLRKKGWSIEPDGLYSLQNKERVFILCSKDFSENGPIEPLQNKKLVNLTTLL